MTSNITAKAAIQIQKPIEVVFHAIIDPIEISRYFLESSTGKIETNKIIQWKFPEFDDIFPVVGKKIQPHEYISFDWSSTNDNMLVEIFLEQKSLTSTIVRIKQNTFKNDEQGINQAIGQTEGWANFLASLKAYLEYGINLRKGAFDYMTKE